MLQIVPYRSRCPFRVYMKSKSTKYGLKVWVLADTEIGGKSERGQDKRVVLDLISDLGFGYGIATDIFFTTLELAEELLNRKLTLTGTFGKTKTFFPLEFMPSKSRPVFSSRFGSGAKLL